ncbi:MAG: polymerase, sigma-24 subunit, subfamily [Bacteroidetes bacterium]|nr:polymerase, sigma-24 subunit, subfamily [Bacteroidota bacterium]
MGSGNSYQSFIAEEVLWNAFRQDDEQAFSEMYRRFSAVLYNYGYHLAGDAAQVQDAMQDLFADLWRTRSLRRRLHRLSDAKAALALDWSLQEESSAEDLRIMSEEDLLQQLRLQKAMRQLPVRQQEAIRLRFYDNFSWEEISGIMGVNEQSVRNLVQRAVVKLRELL